MRFLFIGIHDTADFRLHAEFAPAELVHPGSLAFFGRLPCSVPDQALIWDGTGPDQARYFVRYALVY